MNKLKLLEAMNMIDDDLVKEAEEPSDTVSETEADENTDIELTASGVEVYSRSGWQRFAAIAAAFVLIAGLAGGGAYYLKNRRLNADNDNVIESEIIAPVTNNGNIITTDTDSMESASTVTTDAKQSETTVTDSDKKATETKTTDKKNKDNVESTTSAKESNIYITTDKSNSSGAKSSQTTTKQNSGKTTTYTTTTSPNIPYVRPKVVVPSDGKMTLDETLQFVKYFGEDMTWSDFEPYQHEDIGVGQWEWRIPVYDNGVQKYTLLVNGDIKKKPSGIYLYKGTDTNTQDRIDLRIKSDYVFDFLYPERDLEASMWIFEECLSNSDINIVISSSGSNNNAYLGHSETEHLVDLLQNLEIVRFEENGWQTSSNVSYEIHTTAYSNLHILDVKYPYIFVDGATYRATDSSISALSAYCKEMCDSHQPHEIDINGVWCWYDSATYSGNVRDKSDCITIKQFPDLIFDFLGKDGIISVHNTNGKLVGKVGANFNVYFTDINGDGYPELCSTDYLGINDEIVEAWDIHNRKIYSLASLDNYFYDLNEENGELFLYRDVYSWDIAPGQGEKGRLRIEGDNLIFVPADSNK